MIACVVAGAVFAIGYRIQELDPYLLTVAFGLGLLLMAGLARTSERFGPRVAVALAVLMAGANFALHYRSCDESGNRMVEGYVSDLLTPLPARAVLFDGGWDLDLSASYYLQIVEGLRADVTIVSPELSRTSWYLDELQRRAPELIARVRPQFERYRTDLRRFEDGRPHDGELLEREYREFLGVLALSAMRDRDVFTTGASLPGAPAGWHYVPFGLARRVTSDTSYVPEPRWAMTFRPWADRSNHYVALSAWTWGESRLARARYESQYGHPERAAAIQADMVARAPHFDLRALEPEPLGTEAITLAAADFFRRVGTGGDPLAWRP